MSTAALLANWDSKGSWDLQYDGRISFKLRSTCIDQYVQASLLLFVRRWSIDFIDTTTSRGEYLGWWTVVEGHQDKMAMCYYAANTLLHCSSTFRPGWTPLDITMLTDCFGQFILLTNLSHVGPCNAGLCCLCCPNWLASSVTLLSEDYCAGLDWSLLQDLCRSTQKLETPLVRR